MMLPENERLRLEINFACRRGWHVVVVVVVVSLSLVCVVIRANADAVA